MNNKRNTTPETIINGIRQKSAEDAAVAELILEWWEGFFAPECNQESIKLEFRRGPKGFHPINITSDRKLYLQMPNIRRNTMRFNEADFEHVLDEIGFEKNPHYPWIPLSSLANDETLNKFQKLMKGLIKQLRKS